MVTLAFLLGMTLGGLVAARFADRLRPEIAARGVALCAAAMAVYAFFSKLFLYNVLVPTLAGFGGGPAVVFAIVFVALAMPSVLMGAVLPLAARAAVTTIEMVAERIGWLLALQAAGGGLGVLLGGWLLFGLLSGYSGAVAVTVALQLLAALLALSLSTQRRYWSRKRRDARVRDRLARWSQPSGIAPDAASARGRRRRLGLLVRPGRRVGLHGGDAATGVGAAARPVRGVPRLPAADHPRLLPAGAVGGPGRGDAAAGGHDGRSAPGLHGLPCACRGLVGLPAAGAVVVAAVRADDDAAARHVAAGQRGLQPDPAAGRGAGRGARLPHRHRPAADAAGRARRPGPCRRAGRVGAGGRDPRRHGGRRGERAGGAVADRHRGHAAAAGADRAAGLGWLRWGWPPRRPGVRAKVAAPGAAFVAAALLVLLPGNTGLWARAHGVAAASDHVVAEGRAGVAVWRDDTLRREEETVEGPLFIQGHAQAAIPFRAQDVILGAVALLHNGPRRVLVLGVASGAAPWAAAALPNVAEVRAVEPFPPVLEVLRQQAALRPQGPLAGVLADARIRIETGDPRRVLARSPPGSSEHDHHGFRAIPHRGGAGAAAFPPVLLRAGADAPRAGRHRGAGGAELVGGADLRRNLPVRGDVPPQADVIIGSNDPMPSPRARLLPRLAQQAITARLAGGDRERSIELVRQVSGETLVWVPSTPRTNNALTDMYRTTSCSSRARCARRGASRCRRISGRTGRGGRAGIKTPGGEARG